MRANPEPSRSWLVAVKVVVACAGLAVGCGGDDSGEQDRGASTPTGARPANVKRVPAVGPKPIETPEQALGRIRSRKGSDCEAIHGVDEPGVKAADCARAVSQILPTSPTEVRAYGSGAIVKDNDGSITVLALGNDRRYKLATSFGDGLLRNVPVERADEAMSAALSAIRRDNCEDLLPWAMTDSNGRAGEERFCALKPVRALHRALNRDYTVKLLGGNAGVAFYGLEVKPRDYFTLVFVALDDGYYRFVNSYDAN